MNKKEIMCKLKEFEKDVKDKDFWFKFISGLNNLVEENKRLKEELVLYGNTLKEKCESVDKVIKILEDKANILDDCMFFHMTYYTRTEGWGMKHTVDEGQEILSSKIKEMIKELKGE